MKKINITILGLTLSLITICLTAFEQQSTAQSNNLGCQAINCKAHASCGGSGTPSGCRINCQNGASIDCAPPSSGGGGETGGEGGDS